MKAEYHLNNGHVIKFRDSFSILNFGLDHLVQNFLGVESHKKFQIKNLTKPSEFLSEEAIEYNMLDCKYLAMVLYKVQDISVSEFGSNLLNYLSAPSFAQSLFLSSKYYDYLLTLIYELLDKVDEFIRTGYRGGRTKAFVIGTIRGKINCYDFNSHYASACSNPLPYGVPKPSTISIPSNEVLAYIKDHKGFYTIRINHAPLLKYPVLPQKEKDGIILFPHFNKGQVLECVYTTEIELAISQGYVITLLEGYYFDHSEFMAKFMGEIYQKRLNTKDPVLKELYKLLLNSTYGKFGQ